MACSAVLYVRIQNYVLDSKMGVPLNHNYMSPVSNGMEAKND